MKILSLLTLLTFVVPSAAFTTNCNVGQSTSVSASTSTQCSAVSSDNKNNSRRAFLGNVATASFGIMTATVGVSPALAEVSQGNTLPDGAAQFKRLINLKADIPKIIKRVTENESEIDKKEWDNLSDFLRRLYKGGDDMKAFAKTAIYDPTKKKQADEDIKLLQKLAQAGDGPVSKKDAAGYATIMQKSYDVLDNFFDLLRDVPDEL